MATRSAVKYRRRYTIGELVQLSLGGIIWLIVVVAISAAIAAVYSWLFAIAVNYTWHTHYHAFHFFWMVLVAGSFLGVYTQQKKK